MNRIAILVTTLLMLPICMGFFHASNHVISNNKSSHVIKTSSFSANVSKNNDNEKASESVSNGRYSGEMIWIPPGSFLMGNSGRGNDVVYLNSDELPLHTVYLSGYYIGKYEVTRGEYRKFVNAGGYTTRSYWSDAGWKWKGDHTQPHFWEETVNWGTPPGKFNQTDNHPVIGVTYYEGEAFCNWAGGHLPTEAQWERAARWDATTGHANIYPWGDIWDEQKSNHWTDTVYLGYQTSPVGSYPSGVSPSGCQDMAGNVWEWCLDWYESDYYAHSPKIDPQGPTNGVYRIIRGGGWDFGGPDDRSGFRDYAKPDHYVTSDGFRLAR